MHAFGMCNSCLQAGKCIIPNLIGLQLTSGLNHRYVLNWILVSNSKKNLVLNGADCHHIAHRWQLLLIVL
jgi:hypothetical protein